MIHTIESTDLRIQVNSIGMELCSIFSKSTNQEFIWQGNPEYWTGQAPVLFPIIGALKNGAYFFDGKTYFMPKHGIVRNSNKPKLIESNPNFLRFGMSWDQESLAMYPFKFRLEIQFELVANTLQIQHHVYNEGPQEMYYSIGGHPAFNCPLKPNERYEDYSLEFEKPETDSTCMIDPNGLIDKGSKPFLENETSITLHSHLFDNDALVFRNLNSRKITLTHQTRGKVLAVEFDDFDYLGIWAKPAAPFVCIEPWLGIADSVDSNQNFAEKEGILRLGIGEKSVKTYSITVL